MSAIAIFWIILLIINIVWLDITILCQRKINTPKDTSKGSTIVPSDAASAIIHKALKHLVEGCEDHMAVCPYKEGSLNGLISFSKEALSHDMTSNGIMRMANLEERLLQAQDKYNELLKVTSDPVKLDQYLKKECLCGFKGQCQQHPGKMSKL